MWHLLYSINVICIRILNETCIDILNVMVFLFLEVINASDLEVWFEVDASLIYLEENK